MDMTSFVLGLKKGEASNLKTQEKEVTVTENGTIEVLPDAGYALSKVLMNINIASAPRIFEYLPETTFTNRFVSTFGVYIHYALIDADTMEAWATNRKNVTVVYDNVEYSLTPQLLSDGAGGTGIGVGNAANFGGTGNGEPFLIVQWALSGEPALLIASMVDTAPTEHTIRVYQDLNVGSSVLGDDKWIIASGTASSKGDPVTVEHGLGVMPDIVVVTAGVFGPMSDASNSKWNVVCGANLSEKLMSGAEGDIGYGMAFLFIPKTSSGMVGTPATGLESVSTDAYSAICNVTSNTMQLGTSSVYLLPGTTYKWRAYARK